MLDSTKDFFETLAKVLLRCWIFGFVLLFFSLVVITQIGEFIDDFHGRLFGLSPHELDLIVYCWLGMLKLFVLVFFLMPWMAIELVLRKPRS